MRLHLEQSHRDHRDFFLTEDSARFHFIYEETMELFESLGLAELSTAHFLEAIAYVWDRVPFDEFRMLQTLCA